VLEAMLLGTPVVTSRASSMPEIAGDAAVYVDPYDVDDIADAIKTITADSGLRTNCRGAAGPRRSCFRSPAIASASPVVRPARVAPI